MSRALPYLLVGAGGFLGAIARFLVARRIGVLVDTRFPLGIFLINVTGSFLLGVLATLMAGKAFANPEAVGLALGVGFLGAFTTFSAFELDTHALLASGLWLIAAVNVAASVFVGLAALRVGIVVARALW
jgi:CrcB protein